MKWNKSLLNELLHPCRSHTCSLANVSVKCFYILTSNKWIHSVKRKRNKVQVEKSIHDHPLNAQPHYVGFALTFLKVKWISNILFHHIPLCNRDWDQTEATWIPCQFCVFFCISLLNRNKETCVVVSPHRNPKNHLQMHQLLFIYFSTWNLTAPDGK